MPVGLLICSLQATSQPYSNSSSPIVQLKYIELPHSIYQSLSPDPRQSAIWMAVATWADRSGGSYWVGEDWRESTSRRFCL
jgi:hypothetical protein